MYVTIKFIYVSVLMEVHWRIPMFRYALSSAVLECLFSSSSMRLVDGELVSYQVSRCFFEWKNCYGLSYLKLQKSLDVIKKFRHKKPMVLHLKSFWFILNRYCHYVPKTKDLILFYLKTKCFWLQLLFFYFEITAYY